ncbi:MAG: TIGR03905 family TSCPD domain-containing protein [Oscillospiraceae bacterium]
MTHTRKNKGVCSVETTVTLEDGIIQEIAVEDGCDGNLKGICALVKGMPAADAALRLKGLTCGKRKTSCPDQIALCIEEALAGDQ